MRLRSLITARSGAGSLSFLVAVGAVNLSNLAFHAVGSRLLGPTDYGAFGALLNLIVFLTVPIGAVQAAVTQTVAGRWSEDDGVIVDIRPATANVATAGFGAMGLLLLAAPLINHFLHVTSRAPLTLIAAWLVPAALSAYLQGVLLGEHRFAPVGVSMAAGTAAGRLGIGVMMMRLGTGVSGAMAATLIAQLLTLGVLVWALRDRYFSARTTHTLRVQLRDGLLSMGAITGLALVGGLDVILARHYLPTVFAGDYAAASNAGRIAFFLPAALALLSLPRFASGHGADGTARRALRDSTFVVGGIGSLVALIITVLPSVTVQTVFGAQYRSANAVVGLLAWSAALLGLLTLLTYYFLARQSLVALTSWPAAGLLAALIYIRHGSLDSLAMSVVVTMTLSVLVTVACALDTQLRDTAKAWEEDARWKQVWQTDSTLDVSIVVPFYNPGPGLRDHLVAISRVLEESQVTFEVIAVSDGCTDGSDEDLAHAIPGTIRCIRLPYNQGKGAALHVGLAEGRGNYLGFIDADGDIAPQLLQSFVELVRARQPDIVLGSKRHPMSEVVYPRMRRLYSVAYQSLSWALFRLNVRDTQTGVKLIRRDVLADVLPRMLEKRFAFDLELLVVAKQRGHSSIVELPVRIGRRFTSTIHLRSVFLMLLDTCAIFYRLRIMRFYGPHHRETSTQDTGAGHEGPAEYVTAAGPAQALIKQDDHDSTQLPPPARHRDLDAQDGITIQGAR